MITTAILFTAVFAALIYFIRTRKHTFKRDSYGDIKVIGVKHIYISAAIIIAGMVVSYYQPYTVQRVDAGHVGIKVKLTGDSRGVSDYTYKTGWVVYNTWTESLYEFPTFQQHIEYENQGVITRGGFQATIKPSFNYSIKADAVGDMFQNLRLEIKKVEQGWLKTAIVGSVNDVANRWTVDDIFNKREEFEAAIVAECNKRVSKWFTVSQLRTNITPPPSLQQAIENKTKAIQQAQEQQNLAIVAMETGKKQIMKAKADSAEAVITANGKASAMIIDAKAKAEATRLQKEQITPLYIEYLKVTKWDGQNPSTILGNGASNLVTVK